MAPVIERLHDLLRGLRAWAPATPLAVEVRDPHWLTPDFVAALKDTGATYCLGLHGKMPPSPSSFRCCARSGPARWCAAGT